MYMKPIEKTTTLVLTTANIVAESISPHLGVPVIGPVYKVVAIFSHTYVVTERYNYPVNLTSLWVTTDHGHGPLLLTSYNIT